jgi:putative membrane protein
VSAEPKGGTPERDTRRPASLYRVGDEPDARFSMANERTALAWMRTALAMVAGGVGLTSLASLADLPRLLDAAGAVMCLAGAGLAASAVRGWRRKELALRTGKPLPAPVALPWLAWTVGGLALALAAYVVTRIPR